MKENPHIPEQNTSGAERKEEASTQGGVRRQSSGVIYLFPVPLSAGDPTESLPRRNLELLLKVKYFVVENLRSARRFLKSCHREIDIDSLRFAELSEHTPREEVENLLRPVLRGEDAGIISEAGCPAVADPGAMLVEAAQVKGVKVVPLVGPSSIIMGLMASGFNGQNFAFNGYLPIEAPARTKKLKELERRAVADDCTQIFIETPYRNNRLIDEICHTLAPSTMLCVACDITGDTESVITRPLSYWKKAAYDYSKIPVIFLIGGPQR